jgi:hypothetical protein
MRCPYCRGLLRYASLPYWVKLSIPRLPDIVPSRSLSPRTCRTPKTTKEEQVWVSY